MDEVEEYLEKIRARGQADAERVLMIAHRVGLSDPRPSLLDAYGRGSGVDSPCYAAYRKGLGLEEIA